MTASDPGREPAPTALPTPARSMRPLSARTVALVAAVVLLLTGATIAALVWWVNTSGLVGTELTRARLDAMKIGLSVAVGGGGVFALYLAWRRQRSNEADHQQRDRALEHQRQVANDTNHDAVERRVTDLYTKAADQLGSDKAPVRLAGLYALERLAQNNPDQRQTIVNVLCAYLRMPYDVDDSNERVEGDSDGAAAEVGDVGGVATPMLEREQERQVRLAAQRILANHLRRIGDQAAFWPGLDLDLDGATLVDFDLNDGAVRNASFDGARFHGVTWMSNTKFNELSLKRAWFTGDTRFIRMRVDEMAVFTEVHFDRDVTFEMAEFGSYAEFARAQFAWFVKFDGARFDGRVNFMWARFGKNSYFRGATFGNLASFGDAEFADTAVFDDANFKAGVGFAKATFDGSAVFSETAFADEASFNGTKFNGDALFGGSKFSGSTDFSFAHFGGHAWFAHAQFTGDVWVLTARARIDVSKEDAKRLWPVGWVLLEPKTPDRGHLHDREGVWGELVDSAMFSKGSGAPTPDIGS